MLVRLMLVLVYISAVMEPIVTKYVTVIMTCPADFGLGRFFLFLARHRPAGFQLEASDNIGASLLSPCEQS